MRNLRHPLIASFLLFFVWSNCSAQTKEDGEHLLVSQSPFQLRASGVRFAGLQEEPGSDEEGKIIYRGYLYTESTTPPDGFVVRDIATDAATVYQPTELAIAAGWMKRDAKRDPHNNIWGMFRVNDLIWMGTDGFGILTFDTKTRLWSRYDIQSQPRSGKSISIVFYADEDYVFVGGFHIYSIKRKQWLKVDAVPTRYVARFGRSGELVQLPFDLSRFANQKYLPLSTPSYSPLGVPGKVKLLPDGSGYIFSYHHSQEFPTEFTIEKWQLDWEFSQLALKGKNEKP